MRLFILFLSFSLISDEFKSWDAKFKFTHYSAGNITLKISFKFDSNESATANEKVSKDETTKDKSNLSETTDDQTRNKTKTDSESTGEVISFDKFKKKK